MCPEFLHFLESSSSLLACAFPPLGSAYSEIHSKTIGDTNSISDTLSNLHPFIKVKYSGMMLISM